MTSIFSAMLLMKILLSTSTTAPPPPPPPQKRTKNTKMSWKFQSSHFYGSFSNDIMAVKGLKQHWNNLPPSLAFRPSCPPPPHPPHSSPPPSLPHPRRDTSVVSATSPLPPSLPPPPPPPPPPSSLVDVKQTEARGKGWEVATRS